MTTRSQEGQRTAFKAAYLLGDDGRALFVWLAGEDLPEARRAAVLSLYLRWRRDRAFVFDLLDDLAGAVGLPPLWRRGRILRFIGDLSITIYINHPEDAEVIKRTSALWRRVLRRRLRLHQLLFLVRAPIVGNLQSILTGRTLRMALLTELADPDAMFRQAPDERERFLRMVPLVDPAAAIDSDAQRADLAALLGSAILPHRILAALIIAIHSIHDPVATGRLLRDLRPGLDGNGRLWSLLAYSVPLPSTPDVWVDQLEAMTGDLFERDRATFMAEGDTIVSRFDIALLPLGLAYGKRGLGMPLFDRLLALGRREDPAVHARMIRGLAAVGVYFPYAVFESLRSSFDDLDDPAIATAFVDTLAAMRALHFDAVDLFLKQVRAPDAIRERISAEESSELVSRCVRWVGYYNNAVHESLNYPRMRDALVVNALESLGKAHSAADFMRAHTPTILRLLEDADFDLIRWTEPYATG